MRRKETLREFLKLGTIMILPLLLNYRNFFLNLSGENVMDFDPLRAAVTTISAIGLSPLLLNLNTSRASFAAKMTDAS